MMHGRGKSDSAIVAVKPTNKAERSAAEPVEPRAETKGNADQQSTCRTQSRASVSQALDCMRQALAVWTRGRSRMRESCTYGSVRGALSNERPYRDRREFIALLGGAAAWPLAARAQQHAMPRIGILLLGGPEPMGPFREALHELGYVEGRNVEIEVRSAQGQASRLPELAAELVGRKVDIIVASLTPAIAAAKNATRDIPIVMAPAGDPVATGLVASLARPGGNVTGVSGTASELGAKSLEVIRELLPAAQRVGVVSNATDPFAKPLLDQIQRGAQPLGLVIHPVAVRSADEMEAAFAEIARERADAVIVSGSLPVRSTVDLALKYRLPSLFNQKSIAEAGALAAYSPSFAERARQCAGYVDRILKGARPAELPVEQPTRFELVINLKTAKAIGLSIPSTLLARADEVIE